MDFLGPLGLTLAAAYLLQNLPLYLRWVTDRSVRESREAEGPSERIGNEDRIKNSAWRFDYRFIVLGAFLPDVIDKSIGFWIAPELVNYSLRNVGHSLIGAAFITAITAVLARNLIKGAALSLGVALLAHLILDRMWESPDVLLWPVTGSEFPEGHVPFSWWLNVHFGSLPDSPLDLLGLAILFAFVVRVMATRNALSFLRTGRL